MRLIDADELKKPIEVAIEYSGFYSPIYKGFAKDIDGAPTIDAEPVRHGHWIDRHVTDFGAAEEFCGGCEEWSVGWHKRYRPNCGAKMGEVSTDD